MYPRLLWLLVVGRWSLVADVGLLGGVWCSVLGFTLQFLFEIPFRPFDCFEATINAKNVGAS
jgi:hypothetical protein